MQTLPKITIGVGVVVWRGEDVLLIRRARPPFLGHWSIPGGRLEPGETLHECALRELREETNTHADLIDLINVYESISSDSHYVMVDYVAYWKKGEPVPADDAMDAQFFDYDTACEKLSWDKTRLALRESRVILEKHQKK